MNYLRLYLVLLICVPLIFSSCKRENKILKDTDFKLVSYDNVLEQLVEKLPSDKIIHRATLSNDSEQFYVTISNRNFTLFDIMMVDINEGSLGVLENTTINSPDHDDHGLSFSPDGRSLYFSSTRPRSETDTMYRWSLWKSNFNNGKWDEPYHIPIPNLNQKHISHPSITIDSILYFHVSDLDYSNMSVHNFDLKNKHNSNAQEVKFSEDFKSGTCTPFILSDQDKLLFASIGGSLDLVICDELENGEWTKCNSLFKDIIKNGLGNPTVSSDGQHLFYTTGTYDFSVPWKIHSIPIKEIDTTQ